MEKDDSSADLVPPEPVRLSFGFPFELKIASYVSQIQLRAGLEEVVEPLQ